MAATLISVLKLMDLMDVAFPSDVAGGSLLKHHEGLPLDPEAPARLVPPGRPWI